tara:strand:- start:2563 stop:2994 length:432 start_codon:yes stop_codon:yes gene_type:complete
MSSSGFEIGRKIVSRSTNKQVKPKNEFWVLIWQLIKDPNDFSQVDWARETKASKELFNHYPNVKFWSQLNLGFYLNSLNFFNSADGVKHLRKAINEFENANKIQFQQVVGEKFDESKSFDKKIDKKTKPLNYKDFFKNGKKTK